MTDRESGGARGEDGDRLPRLRVWALRLWVASIVWVPVAYAAGRASADCGTEQAKGVGWWLEQAAIVLGAVAIPLALVLVAVFLTWSWWWRAGGSVAIAVVHLAVLVDLGFSCGVGS